MGFPQGASGPGKRLRPAAASGVPAPARRLRRHADPPSAPRAPANFPRLPPARVYTCSWFCGAGPHSLTCPRVAGRCLSHSPSLQARPPRVTRTVNPSLRDQSPLPRDFGGASARSPALVYTASAAPRSLNTSHEAQRPRPHRLGDASSLGPRPHCSSLTRPFRARTGTQTPRQPLSVEGGAPIFSGRPARPETPAGGCLPCPRPHAPVQAIPSLSYIGARLSMVKENVVYPLPVTWQFPTLPPFLFFRPLRQYWAPAAGRRPGNSGQARLTAAGRALGGEWAGSGRGREGRGTRAPAALPGEALVCDSSSCSGS